MRSTCAFVEPVQIQVIESQASVVRIYESEGRTSDVFFFNTEC